MATILLVDDRPANLLVMEAGLEELGQNLVSASSGPEALKSLLKHDVAVILLDVEMPGMSGFETAALVKTRPRTQNVPIIFLTASSDEKNVFAGYDAGAVDYIVKPYDPQVLLSKVSVFVDLYHQRERLARQAEQLRVMEVAELRRIEQDRYIGLAEAIPQVVWTAGADDEMQYFNSVWYELTGMTEGESLGMRWLDAVHPDDRDLVRAAWIAPSNGEAFADQMEVRLRDVAGGFCWHLGHGRRMDEAHGGGSVGTFTDISAQKALFEERDEVARVLQSSLLPTRLPELEFMDAGLRYRPAGHGIGGDFYDLFARGDGSVVLLVGDVCGKGVEAATVTGVARHTLRAGAFTGLGPAALLGLLNDMLLRNETTLFLSVACAVIEPEAGGLSLTLASGGHLPPVIVHPDGRGEELAVPGILVGVAPGWSFVEHRVHVAAGSYVAMFTDGVVEGRDAQAEQFGGQRAIALLGAQMRAGASADEAAEALLEAAVDWQPGEPGDDTAVLIVRAGGGGSEPTPGRL